MFDLQTERRTRAVVQLKESEKWHVAQPTDVRDTDHNLLSHRETPDHCLI